MYTSMTMVWPCMKLWAMNQKNMLPWADWLIYHAQDKILVPSVCCEQLHLSTHRPSMLRNTWPPAQSVMHIYVIDKHMTVGRMWPVGRSGRSVGRLVSRSVSQLVSWLDVLLHRPHRCGAHSGSLQSLGRTLLTWDWKLPQMVTETYNV